MLIEKFTLSAQDAMERASRLAVRHGHRHITPAHLVLGLLDPEVKTGRRILTRAGATVEAIENAAKALVSKTPPVENTAQGTPISRDLERVFVLAEEAAKKQEQRYISIHHLFSGLLEDKAIEQMFSQCETDLEELKKVAENARSGGFSDAESSDYQYLSQYTQDLTQLAREQQLDPVISRSGEIRQLMQILNRRRKNNVILVGEPGVGKTAVVEGLAQRIIQGDVPENLKDHAVLSLDLAQLVAGTQYRGEFEQRLKNLLNEAIDAGNVLLFIDEIHMIIGAGSTEGSMDASNLLKPALSRGQIRCIGATTTGEYRKRIEKDQALTRRFQVVDCEEPSEAATVAILRGVKEKYEAHHGVRITDTALHAAAKLSHRYLNDRFLPDKAIDLIDETASSLRMDISAKPGEIDDIDREIVSLKIEIGALEAENDASTEDRRKEIQDQLNELEAQSAELTSLWEREKKAVYVLAQAKEELEQARRELEQAKRDGDFARAGELQFKVIPSREAVLDEIGDVDLDNIRFLKEAVGEDDVARTLSRWTGIPVNKMLDSEREKLLKMEELLTARVVGQPEPIHAVSKALRRSRAGLQDPSRPIASFLMVGPTGVGKTELSKALAEFMFDDERALVRVDMSEYMEKHAVARLVGAPPGYVGYEEAGLLTNAVRRKPYSVVLLDEVEKAHPDVFNLLLQVLDDGRLTDGQGITVDFTNTIIILTSNLGTRQIENVTGESAYEEMKKTVEEAVKAHFRPEFINRLDDLIVFQRLGGENMLKIVEIQLRKLVKRLAEHKMTLDIDHAAKEALAHEGISPLYGARPLQRVIQRRLSDALSEAILRGDINNGDTVCVRLIDDQFIIKSKQNMTDLESSPPASEEQDTPVEAEEPSPEPTNQAPDNTN